MTMYVPAPEQERIRVCNLYGQEMFEGKEPDKLPDGRDNPDAGKPKEAWRIHQEWLLDRTTDPKFLSHGKAATGFEAARLLRLARRQIKANVGKSGFHAYDDDVLERLKECILRPTNGLLGPVEYEHNWFDWSECWTKTTDTLPAVCAQPDPPALLPTPGPEMQGDAP